MDKIKIMIVEDDLSVAKEIAAFLMKWGYDALYLKNFENVLDMYHTYMPHLILMDITLPYYDGYYWVNMIRQESTLPIIFVSSRQDDKDKVMAIMQGGDDYIEKPFSLELLKAKIQALLRRTYQYKVNNVVMIREDLYYDQHKSIIKYKDIIIDLTKSENTIVAQLVENKGNIVSRDALMNALWNTNEFVMDNTLNVMISRLRNKLKDICKQEIIYTKKGCGYYI